MWPFSSNKERNTYEPNRTLYTNTNPNSYTTPNSNINTNTNEINKILQDLSNLQNSRTTSDLLNDVTARIRQQNKLIELLLVENMELRRKVGNNSYNTSTSSYNSVPPSSSFRPLADLELNPQILRQWESSISLQSNPTPSHYAPSTPYRYNSASSSQTPSFQQPASTWYTTPAPVPPAPKPPKEVNIMKRVEGTIACVGKITEKLTSHEIFSRNPIHINFVTGPPYEIVLLFYRVLARVDIVELHGLLQELKDKKVIIIFLHYVFETTRAVRSESFVVENTKHLVMEMVDMTFKDEVLYEVEQNSSAILHIAQKIQQLAE